MKKIILPMLACILASLSFSGCSYDDSVVARVRTTYYTISPNDWLPVADGNQVISYYVPCLNNDVDFTNGAITAYLCHEDGDKALPYTIYNSQIDAQGFIVEWEDHLSYDIQSNGITFTLESSDFSTHETLNNIGKLQFKVCVIRNEYLR